MKEKLNDLVDKYIKEDEKEKLWELALNYEDKINLNKIANYYIKEKNPFYICELLCVVSEYLDLDYIFNKIIATNDKKFIFLILNNGTIKGIIDNKYIAILNDVCNLEK